MLLDSVRIRILYWSCLVVILNMTSCTSDDSIVDPGPMQDDCLCLNDIQVIGSHNSYKIAVEEPILDFISQFDPSLSRALEYEHILIQAQLELGLRNLEYDVFYDPDGGKYAEPRGLDIVSVSGTTPQPFDTNKELEGKGLKMFHIQDVDFRSHHLLFTDGLEELKNWSDANPDHAPIFMLINAKDSEVPLTTNPLTFTADALVSIDTEIRNVFGEDQLITPDLVRGEFTTLEEAILTNGWPELETSKGKILFVLDENSTKTDLYLSRFPGLENAVMFVNRQEGNPEAAFRIINDPVDDFDQIQALVNLGYLVRTRADSETIEARDNDLTRFERAQASGAQIISTDYYLPPTLFSSDYQVIFDDGSYERIKN